MNTIKTLITYITVLIVFNLSFNTTYCQNTKDSILSDTSKKVNYYLAKGLQARKLIYVYKQQHVNDSLIIKGQDTLNKILFKDNVELKTITLSQDKVISKQRKTLKVLFTILGVTFFYEIFSK